MDTPMMFDVPTIRQERFFGSPKVTLEYHPQSDSFYLYPHNGIVPATSVHLHNGLHARIHLETGELAGFHIEGYKSHFLQRNRSLQEAWKALFQSEGDHQAVQQFARTLKQLLLDRLEDYTGKKRLRPRVEEDSQTNFLVSTHA